jgi:phosphoribosyl-ATP pyrophosphohydrolase
MTPRESVLDRIMQVIHERKKTLPVDSYTARLLAGGIDALGDKILEEAAEVVEAAGEAGEDGRRHLVHEAADLLFHLLVLLGHRDLTLRDVEAELERREGVSGLRTKAHSEP